MYFLSIFVLPLINSSGRNNTGICDIENKEKISIERICQINNTSNLVRFYESPRISTLDKLDMFERTDFDTNMAFQIFNGGLLYEDFEKMVFLLF
jgi:hypothetical protein